MRAWRMVAGVYGAMAVGFAAWGAHGASGQAAAWVERGSLFQLVHAVALLALAGWGGGRLGALAAAAMAAGVALFSGSLYLKALGVPLPVPMITPTGGVLLLLSWLLIAFISLRR